MAAFLIRHAHAGSRSAWDQPDSIRPLSTKGRRQAEALVDLIGDRDIEVVLSSPARRCIETVEPLAAHLGLEIAQERRLFEGNEATDALAVLDEYHDRSVALCSHGDLIPGVIRLLGLRGLAIAGESGNQKGSVWVLEHDGERFDKAEYVPAS